MDEDIAFEYSSLTKKWTYKDIEVEIIPEGYVVKILYIENDSIICKVKSQYGLIYFLNKLLGKKIFFRSNAEVDADYLV